MVNLSRNVLLNIAAAVQATTVDAELQQVIPLEFSPLRLAGGMTALRAALLPGESNNETAFLAAKVLQLVYSSPVQAYMAQLPQILTFSPVQNLTSFTSGYSYDLVTVGSAVQRVIGSSGIRSLLRKAAPSEVVEGLEGLLQASTSVLDVASVSAVIYILNAAYLVGSPYDS